MKFLEEFLNPPSMNRDVEMGEIFIFKKLVEALTVKYSAKYLF